MKLLIVVLLGVLAARGQAASWWFSGDEDEEIIDAQEDVTQECLDLARWGQCGFYDCMERRFPCGLQGYNQRISKHFCTKIDQNYDQFDDYGELWLNQTSICLVGFMLPIYRDQEQTTCDAIKQKGIESIVSCNDATVANRGFCDFLATNGDAYMSLMGTPEVRLLMSLQDRRVIQSMLSDTMGCSLESFRNYVSDITSSFTSAMGSLWNSIWGGRH